MILLVQERQKGCGNDVNADCFVKQLPRGSLDDIFSSNHGECNIAEQARVAPAVDAIESGAATSTFSQVRRSLGDDNTAIHKPGEDTEILADAKPSQSQQFRILSLKIDRRCA